jgi:hypothetical protein
MVVGGEYVTEMKVQRQRRAGECGDLHLVKRIIKISRKDDEKSGE